jgi:hypothetical protein
MPDHGFQPNVHEPALSAWNIASANLAEDIELQLPSRRRS